MSACRRGCHEVAKQNSPGLRPGLGSKKRIALKGRPTLDAALATSSHRLEQETWRARILLSAALSGRIHEGRHTQG